MHTLLVNKDNTFTTTHAERIVQRSKLTNTIHILVPNDYHGVKMNECLAIMYYKLPISGEWHPMELTPSEELYKESYVEYKFMADTWLTSEYGDVEIELKFYKVSMSEGINIDQYVRKVTDGVIHISASKDWASGIADSLLDSVDQRIIQLMMIQNRQDEMITESQNNCPTSLAITDGKMHLINAIGEKKGDAFDIVLPRIEDTDGIDDGLLELYDENIENDTSEDENGFIEL